MDTETLDKLYLEWSQFTSARTSRELVMEKAIRRAIGMIHCTDYNAAMKVLGIAVGEPE